MPLMPLLSPPPRILLRREQQNFRTPGTADPLLGTGQTARIIAPILLQVLDSPTCLDLPFQTATTSAPMAQLPWGMASLDMTSSLVKGGPNSAFSDGEAVPCWAGRENWNVNMIGEHSTKTEYLRESANSSVSLPLSATATATTASPLALAATIIQDYHRRGNVRTVGTTLQDRRLRRIIPTCRPLSLKHITLVATLDHRTLHGHQTTLVPWPRPTGRLLLASLLLQGAHGTLFTMRQSLEPLKWTNTIERIALSPVRVLAGSGVLHTYLHRSVHSQLTDHWIAMLERDAYLPLTWEMEAERQAPIKASKHATSLRTRSPHLLDRLFLLRRDRESRVRRRIRVSLVPTIPSTLATPRLRQDYQVSVPCCTSPTALALLSPGEAIITSLNINSLTPHCIGIFPQSSSVVSLLAHHTFWAYLARSFNAVAVTP